MLGLSLIERAILSSKESGINDFLIVVGYKGEEVEKYLEEKERRLDLDVGINFVRNEEWEKGNGLSLLKANGALKGKEDFLLLMCDHVFDPSILEDLISRGSRNGKCILCVDKPENSFDLKDATKIRIEGNKPKSIGKEIEDYNAVDCGIFYCTEKIFDALENAISKGKYELSNVVQGLIEEEDLGIFEIGGRFWCDIDTPESLRYAEERMLKSLEKPTDGIISRYINRKVSRKISAIVVNTNLTPNQISVISFIIALASAAFFFLGEYRYLIIGGILVQMASIVDGCDGEIARLKFLRTDYGAFLDSVLDRYADGIMILCLIFGYWMLQSHGSISVWIIGLFALVGSYMISYTNARHESIFGTPINSKRSIPVRRDMRLFLIMIGALLNQVLIILLILAIFCNLEVFRRVFFAL